MMFLSSTWLLFSLCVVACSGQENSTNKAETTNWLILLVGGVRTYVVVRNSLKLFLLHQNYNPESDLHIDMIGYVRYDLKCPLEVVGAELLHNDCLASTITYETATSSGHMVLDSKGCLTILNKRYLYL